MKNITVSVDDETYRLARIEAARRDTSVSAMVKQFLTRMAAGETEFARLERQEQIIREQIKGFSGGDRLTRDELYERGG